MPVELTPRGTFGAQPSPGPRWLMKAAMSMGSAFMRRRGVPVVQLTTVGAQTGQERTTDLIAVRDGPGIWTVAASAAGRAAHPAWYFNMAKHPDKIWLRDGSQRVRVEASNLSGGEAEAAYSKLTAVWKSYATYLTKTDRQIPVVRLTAAQ